jgi:hypothetical protein
VAIHISGGHGGWLDKADVLIETIPASGMRAAVGWVVPPYWISFSGSCSLHVHACDKAVGGGSIKKRCRSGDEEDARLHCVESEDVKVKILTECCLVAVHLSCLYIA